VANRFQKSSAIVSFLAASSIACSASAQSVNKTMAAGTTLNLGHFGAVNPDCTSRGKTTIRLTIAPAHGSVRLKEDKDFGVFWKPHVCGARRVAGVTVEYRPERGFVGVDTVGFDVIYATGDERMSTVNIAVK
jgi:hypothetical protein